MLAALSALHDKLKGYRTILFGLIVASIDILDATDLTAIVPPSWKPYWMVAQPVAFLWLRTITHGPIGSKATG